LKIKWEFRRFRTYSVSAAIGIDRLIFGPAFPASNEQQCAKDRHHTIAIDLPSTTICHREGSDDEAQEHQAN
jgi:hypothetical protein